MHYGAKCRKHNVNKTANSSSALMCVDSTTWTCPAADMARRRSIVWGFFKPVDSESVQCVLCRGYLVKRGEGTTNMLRHLRVKHPTEVLKKRPGRGPEASSSIISGRQDLETDSEHFCSGMVTSVTKLRESAAANFWEYRQTLQQTCCHSNTTQQENNQSKDDEDPVTQQVVIIVLKL